MVKAVLKALRGELARRRALTALEAGPTVDEEDAFVAMAREAGPAVFDRVTGEQLEGRAVRAERREDMAYYEELQVFERVPTAQAVEETGYAPISVDWVDVSKGDRGRAEVRSRLVVQETRRVSSIPADDIASTFAATPPLEALRWLLAAAVTESPGEAPVCERALSFLDISRAHLHSPIRRRVYVKAPKEDLDAGPGDCWLLRKAMYGLRDAGQRFGLRV